MSLVSIFRNLIYQGYLFNKIILLYMYATDILMKLISKFYLCNISYG